MLWPLSGKIKVQTLKQDIELNNLIIKKDNIL